ncbi:hypothetical protein [Porphyromonas somerae]|uniref:hypothetical protein n=1 Tax=Porphyromonas somerae TaxID=322095 RepID=UPI001FCC161F|nr:hypothetical protein [Porphyromonas somerae]BDE81805.1 hypothetical protein CE91St14_08330 [Porphyromonas somerae]
MDDKKLPVVWHIGETYLLNGHVKFGEYELYIGIYETRKNSNNPREAAMFLHSGKPCELELIEATVPNMAVALNVIGWITQADIARMIKEMMEEYYG